MLAMLACVFQQHYTQSMLNHQKQKLETDQKQQQQEHTSTPSSPPTPLTPFMTTSIHTHQLPSYRTVPSKVQSQHNSPKASPISSSWQNVNLDGEPHFLEMEEQHEQQCK